jgi:hypothetical protein
MRWRMVRWIAAMSTVLLLASTVAESADVAVLEPRPRDVCPLRADAAAAPKDDPACLACHGPGGTAPTLRATHPVGQRYAEARAAKRSAEWALRAEDEVLRRGLELPDGRVACLTCHRGGGNAPFLLVQPAPEGLGPRAPMPTPLCLACHQQL